MSDTEEIVADVDPVAQRRAEIELEMEHLDLLDAYRAAKENESADPDAYRAAKKAFSDHRTYWRQIGEAVGNRKPGAAVTEEN